MFGLWRRGGVAFLLLAFRWTWVVSFTFRPFFLGRNGIRCLLVWMRMCTTGSSNVVAKIMCLHLVGVSNHDRPSPCWHFSRLSSSILGERPYISVVREVHRGRDSSVGIATRYGLDGPGIESRWGRDFSHTSRLALGPTQPPIQWVPGIFRG